MYLEDFRKGEDYSALKECVHISILGFNLEQADDFYSVIKLTDVSNHKVYSSKLSLRVLYLNKLKDATEEDGCLQMGQADIGRGLGGAERNGGK